MKNRSVLFSGIMILFCVSVSFSQIGYLKIGDIKGESTERGHKEWIDVLSISQGLEKQKATTGTSRRRGATVLRDLIITKKLDKATPKLMEFCAKGKVVPKLELDMVTNGKLHYKLTLSNARVNSINTNTICNPNCELIDEVSIGYSQITWEYRDSTGNKVVTTYNAKTGI